MRTRNGPHSLPVRRHSPSVVTNKVCAGWIRGKNLCHQRPDPPLMPPILSPCERQSPQNPSLARCSRLSWPQDGEKPAIVLGNPAECRTRCSICSQLAEPRRFFSLPPADPLRPCVRPDRERGTTGTVEGAMPFIKCMSSGLLRFSSSANIALFLLAPRQPPSLTRSRLAGVCPGGEWP